MGTLFEQKERNWYYVEATSLESDLAYRIEVSKKLKISLADVLKYEEVAELRRANNLRVCDYDAKDEQLAGFGELLETLNATLARLVPDEDEEIYNG